MVVEWKFEFSRGFMSIKYIALKGASLFRNHFQCFYKGQKFQKLFFLVSILIKNKRINLPNIALGSILILRQQGDWVGGVRKMVIFADVQYYLC